MPLVSAKCTNCGANLNVDNTKDAAVCPYCGSAFIVEKAINNYYVTNHIKADVVNIYGSQSSDFDIRAGKLMKYTGASMDVVIPDTVVSIDCLAFADLSLSSVTIPPSVTEMEGAFKYCKSVQKVTISDGVKSIGYQAFSDCRFLTSVTIPNSVTSIEVGAFWGCCSLAGITIPNSVTRIGGGAFGNCRSLNSVTIPNGVKSIEHQTFEGCIALTNVTIPNSVTSIAPGAFKGCEKLVSIQGCRTEELLYAAAYGTPVGENLGICSQCGKKTTFVLGKCVRCRRKKLYT